MNWVDIIVIIILILSFFGGIKDGAFKSFFSLVALIIAIPLAGISYRLIATILSFLPGTNWENFFGFFITMGIIIAILQILFLLPRKIIQTIWKKGLVFRLVGGVLNIFDGMIGFTVFSLLVIAFPIFDWLERWVNGSGVLMSLVKSLGFIQAMLPELFHKAGPFMNIITSA